MRKLFYISIIFFTLVIPKTTNASHISGTDISYACTSTPNVYKIILKVYRDCSGTPICSGCSNPIPNGAVTGCTASAVGFSTSIIGATDTFTGVNYGSFTLNAVAASSGIDILQTCTSVKTICTNCNTRTAGTYSPSIEVYTFEGNVNLSLVPTACCKVVLAFSICCRNIALSTMNAGNLYYTEAVLNRCQTTCNSSPIFTNEAKVILCSGLDVNYNLGAIDPDGDSLSYEFAPSLEGPNINTNYILPYSPSYPFPYFGAPNANAGFPAGLRIDPTTGNIMFRPMGVFSSILAIGVTQWKLVSGVWTNVGYTRRDVQFQSLLCLSNRAPIIKIYRNGIRHLNNNNFELVAGQPFCLDIVCEDLQDLATTPPINADSTELSWNNPGLIDFSMSNAAFTRNYILAQRSINGPKADSFKFCWTPPISAIRNTPHLFTVNGSDRYCPIKTEIVSGIALKVSSKIIFIDSIVTKKTFCNDRINLTNINYQTNSLSLSVNNVFTVQLSDSLGLFSNATVIGTKASTDFAGLIPVVIPANLPLNKNYKIRVNCSSDTSYKGIEMTINFTNGFIKPTITSNKDSICNGLTASLQASPTGNNFSYRWLNNNQLITNPSANFIAINEGNYRVIVSNTGCTDTSLVKKITILPKPIASIGLGNFCSSPNAVNIGNSSTITSGIISYNWTFTDNTTSNALSPSKIFADSGSITATLLVTSNFNCRDSVTKTITIKKTPKANFNINDTLQCVTGNKFDFINTSLGNGNTYGWLFGDNSSSGNNNSSKTYTNAGNYLVKLMAISNGCVDSIIKPITVVAKANNVNFSINQSTQCLNRNNFVFTNNSTPNNNSLTYFWIFGNGDTSTLRSTNTSYVVNGTFTVKLKVVANKECIDSFTNNVIVNTNPKANFTINDTLQCVTGNRFTLINASNGGSTYIWNFGDNTTNNNVNNNKVYTNAGNYAIKLVASSANGCNDSIVKNVNVVAKATNVDFSVNQISQCLRGNNFVFNNNSTPNNNTLNYLWIMDGATISTNRNPANFSTNKLGVIPVSLVVVANGECIDTIAKNITVTANPTIGNILGNVNPNSSVIPFTYSVLNQANSTYNWTTTNATIQSGQGTNQISVLFTNAGNAKIAAQITDNNSCSDSTSLNISVTVGVNELSLENDLKVYPNPTKSILTITNKNNILGKKYIITNLIGQTVLTGKLNLDETIINTESLTNGVYLLSIDGLNKQAIKVIKE
ncbi:MAG: PKD domain-containing protein [Candidatus Methylacidiphilales bacterium]